MTTSTATNSDKKIVKITTFLFLCTCMKNSFGFPTRPGQKSPFSGSVIISRGITPSVPYTPTSSPWLKMAKAKQSASEWFCPATVEKTIRIYIIITKNICYLLWNKGLWRSSNNTYPIFLTPCIRCTNHLCDSCDLTDVNPHFIPSLLRMIQNVDLLWRHRYKPWHFTDVSATLLPSCRWNIRAIGHPQNPYIDSSRYREIP